MALFLNEGGRSGSVTGKEGNYHLCYDTGDIKQSLFLLRWYSILKQSTVHFASASVSRQKQAEEKHMHSGRLNINHCIFDLQNL